MTLVEVAVVMVIALLLAAIGGLSMSPVISRKHVTNCLERIRADVGLVRSQAQSEGERGVVQLTSTSSAADLDGDGTVEYYMGYLDKDKNGLFSSAAGDVVLVHGVGGDALCKQQVQVDPGTTIRKIRFDPLGYVMSGATNKNIYLKASKNGGRLELISLTGKTRLFLNTDSCGGNSCSASDNWQELQ